MTSTTARRRARRNIIRAIPSWVYVVLSAVIVLPPAIWTLSTSLKPAADTIKFPPEWIPNPIPENI